MPSDKFGVITFFGILIPGAYLAGILVISVASGIELCGLAGHESIVSFVSQYTALSAGVFLFVAYLLGVLVRLFAPEYVDKLSTLYLVHVRRNNEKWVKDKFPYKETLTFRLSADGMVRVPQLMSRLNSTYGRPGNTSFFNYCKWFIDANNIALSMQVQEGEALVRFLSGTSLVLLITLPLALTLLIAFAFHRAGLSAALYFGLVTIDIISLALILERFKYQRRREVIMVWSCVYLIVNGSTPGDVEHKRDRLCESVFFSPSTA
jgi:hypothetical protein